MYQIYELKFTMKLLSDEDITLVQEAFLEKHGWVRSDRLYWTCPLTSNDFHLNAAFVKTLNWVKTDFRFKPTIAEVDAGELRVLTLWKTTRPAIDTDAHDTLQEAYTEWVANNTDHPDIALFAPRKLSYLTSLAPKKKKLPAARQRAERQSSSRREQEMWLIEQGWLRVAAPTANSPYRYTKEDVGVNKPVFLATAIRIEEEHRSKPALPVESFLHGIEFFDPYEGKEPRARKETEPAPIDCIEDSLLRTAYSDYLNGMSVEQIVFHLQYACEVSISVRELNHYLDLMNEALL